MPDSQPLEIERKYLIEYPDVAFLETLPQYSRTEITQTYLSIEENGAHGRVRKRGKNGKYIYTKTFKREITDMTRVEIESHITREEYEQLLVYKQEDSRTIEKERITFSFGGKNVEIDIYPFWNDKAVMEIEFDSESESKAYLTPPFIKVIRDVTYEKEFRNSSIALNGIPKT